MITTEQLRASLSKEISKIAERKTHLEIAELAQVTEQTVYNAIHWPHRVRLETLERILERNTNK